MSVYNKIMSAVFAKLGYTLDQNILDIVLHPAQHKLIKAPAGGTKTTLSQLILAKEKLEFIQKRIADKNAPQYLDTSEILCLVYNNHNVPDVVNVHKKIYNVFSGFGLFSQVLQADNFMVPGISAHTVHSHAKTLVEKYKSFVKLREVKLSAQPFLDELLKASFGKVMGAGETYTPDVRKLYGLYTNLLLYKHDTYKDHFLFIAEMDENTYVKYKAVFDSYDNTKRVIKEQEFSDWIKYAIDLYENPANVVAAERRKYKLIVADEVQDFTPLMLEYLKYLISDKAKTIVIGDPDQTIYQFNGAFHTTLDMLQGQVDINFTKFFMTTNRRCSERTMSYARALLARMTDREPFHINTVKPGGEFKLLYYNTQTEELDNVMDDFDKIHYSTNAFLFREGAMAIPLTRRLFEEGRPYSLFNATSFHMHAFYKGFLETIKRVFVFQDRTVWNSLHHILPISKKKLDEFLVFDNSGKPTAFPEVSRWSKLDWMQTKKTYSTADAWFWQMIFAQGLAENVDTVSARDVVDVLINMYRKNFFDYLGSDDTYLEDVVDMVRRDFDTDNNLKWLVSHLETRINNAVMYKKIGSINICTIHATKGLEFDRVYLMSMQKRDTHQFDTQVELRLHYVGATRQRHSLILSIDEVNQHPLTTAEFVVAPTVELENRFDIKPNTNLSGLFSSNENPNIRRVFK